MSALQVTFDGRNYTFAPGATVRIGRSSENDVVVNDPTVSRRHAQLSWEAAGWVWQNAGQAPTFLAGQPVAQFAVGQQVDVCLASPQGPALRLATAPEQAAGPMKTELAAGAGQTNVAGQSPGYGGQGARVRRRRSRGRGGRLRRSWRGRACGLPGWRGRAG